jgi:hypothetical protein
VKKILFFLLISVGLKAQFNYQAILKDSNGNLLTNNQVKFKFSLMYQSSTASPFFVEEHEVITPPDGVVNLSIGGGTVVNGIFSNIDWSQSVFMKEELDRGSGYQDMGTKQVASVPIAEYAKNAANLYFNNSTSQSSTSIVETTSVVSASAFIGDGSSLLWSQNSTQTLSDKINELISLNNVRLPSYIPTDGLVAYYPFNGNANDASGNGNVGSVSEQVSLTSDITGVADSAYEFIVNGDAGWGQPQGEISVPHNVSMNSNSLTLSALVYPREKPGSYENRDQTVLGRWANGTSNEAFRFWVDDDGGIVFNVGVGQNESYKAGNILFDAWSHIAITLDNRDLKIFINGSLVGEHQFDSDINVNGNSPLNIGSLLSSNGTWYFWDGYLDEIGYWNRILSSNEIKNLSSSFSLNSSPMSCLTCNTTDTESNTIIEATGIVSATGFKGNGDEITLTNNDTVVKLLDKIDELERKIKSLELNQKIALNLGSRFGGGRVFYIFQEGDPGYVEGEVHGLVIADEDLDETRWTLGDVGNFTSLNISNYDDYQTSAHLNAGSNDTDLLIEFQENITGSFPAINAAYNAEINGFDDWYLPSLGELVLIRESNDPLLLEIAFSNGYYWTSSLMSNLLGAMALDMNESGTGGFCGCAFFESYKIRPIRKF